MEDKHTYTLYIHAASENNAEVNLLIEEFQQILETAKEEGRINDSSLEWAETAIST